MPRASWRSCRSRHVIRAGQFDRRGCIRQHLANPENGELRTDVLLRDAVSDVPAPFAPAIERFDGPDAQFKRSRSNKQEDNEGVVVRWLTDF